MLIVACMYRLLEAKMDDARNLEFVTLRYICAARQKYYFFQLTQKLFQYGSSGYNRSRQYDS